ncbi:MAG: PEP-CTERM sorting domain-containing protein [Planctomycetota bacterium]
MRLNHVLVLLAVASPMFCSAASAQQIFRDSGADASGIQDGVDTFRNLLGGLNANSPENFDGGRRQINWDAAPDSVSDPNAFPGDFFNADFSPRARGIEFKETGDTTGFLLSSTEASGQPTDFGFNLFEPFSPERLFTPVGGNTFDVVFYDPANPEQNALTSGLGVIFSDVDEAALTTMSFFDIDGNLLAQESPDAFNGGFSFLGVAFDEPVIAKVSIVSGDLPILSNGVFGSGLGGSDGVVMDDFIFGEPTPLGAIPEPTSAGLLIAALIGLGRAGWTRKS